MRICHFFQSVRPEVGGPARAVLDLCSALAKRGHDVTLATCDSHSVPEDWREGQQGLPHHVLLPRPAFAGAAFSPMQLREARELLQQTDVLHVHGAWTYLNVQLARIATKQGVPYVISVRGMLDDWCVAQKALKKKIYLSLVGKRWLDGARAVHLTAQAELDQSRKHFPRGHGVVIPNLLDLGPFRNMPGPALARTAFPALKELDKPAVLFLSRIHTKKRLGSLLESMALLKQRGLNATLLIAGTGEPRYVCQMRDHAERLGLSANEVCFLDQVVGDLKLSLYQACDIFALPTSQENFGFVFAESLACGTPIVTTRGVDIWSELESSGAAVIAAEQSGPFADALEELLSNRQQLITMGQQGREWVFQWLDTERLLDRFEAMYQGDEDPSQ